MKKILFVSLLFLGVLLLGCDEKDQKEFADAMKKQAIDDANPLKPHNSKPKPTPQFNDREACSEVSEEFVCVDGMVYRSKCDGVWKSKEYIGPVVEYCEPDYHRVSCKEYKLVETGGVDEVSYCLAGGAQTGRTYCRGGEIRHKIVNCEDNGQVCKETTAGVHECVTAPPKGYCDYDYLTQECPIQCYPSGSSEPGKQCLQAK